MPAKLKVAVKKQCTEVIKGFPGLELPKFFLSGKHGISQSLLLMQMQCDRQFLFSANRWEVPGKEHNTFFGTCCHEIMDVVYSFADKPTFEMIEEVLSDFLRKEEEKGKLTWLSMSDRSYYETIILYTMFAYFEFYEKDFEYKFIELENIFKTKFHNIWLTGKKDGVVEIDGKKYLFEHKTKGMINQEQIELNLDINFQTQFYMLAHRLEHRYQLDGVLYNIIRRTKSRPHKNESLKAFGERLYKEIMADPSYFFIRYTCEYNQQQIDEFEEELGCKVDNLTSLINGTRKPLKNEAFCIGNFECPFLRACATKSLTTYRQRNVVSPELE